MDANGIAISRSAGAQISPVVAANGGDYLVVWNVGGGIKGARVTSAGTVSDPNGIPFPMAHNDAQFAPAIAADDSGYLSSGRIYVIPQATAMTSMARGSAPTGSSLIPLASQSAQPRRINFGQRRS